MEKLHNYRFILNNLQLFNSDDEHFDDDDFNEEVKEEEKAEAKETKSGKDEPSKEESKSTETQPTKKQNREENARQAEQRRLKAQKEREEKLKADAYLKGQLDAQKINTFTNKPINDEHDLSIFKLQCELEKQGKDPIEDLPDAIANQAREKFKQEQEAIDKQKKHDEDIQNDIKDFESKHNVKAKDILADEKFSKFANKFIGKMPLSDIYEAYEEIRKDAEEDYKAKAKAKKEVEESKNKGGSPSASGGQKKIDKPYTAMTKEERYASLKSQGLI